MSKQEILRTELRDRILNGHYLPGEPITERIVAEELGTSRVPVRAALLQLEQDGLVSLIPNRGAYVRAFSPADLKNIFEARAALEGMALRLAVARMDPDELRPIVEEYREMLERNEIAEPEHMASLGNKFHDAIIGACGNPVIARMVSSIADQVRLARRLYFPHTSKAQLMRVASQHIQLAEVISERDPDRAERMMRKHITDSYDLFRISPDGLDVEMDHELSDR